MNCGLTVLFKGLLLPCVPLTDDSLDTGTLAGMQLTGKECPSKCVLVVIGDILGELFAGPSIREELGWDCDAGG